MTGALPTKIELKREAARKRLLDAAQAYGDADKHLWKDLKASLRRDELTTDEIKAAQSRYMTANKEVRRAIISYASIMRRRAGG